MGIKSQKRTLLRLERLEKQLCMYCGELPHEKDRKGCAGCLEKCNKRTCKHSKAHPEKATAYRRHVRKEVIEKYGGICSCCPENRWQFLTIDHTDKNGNQERRELYGSQSGASYWWYLKLRREPIRPDLRVLCYNCNNAIHVFGVCPHEQERNQGCVSQSGL
jgi:hypothetical protein